MVLRNIKTFATAMAYTSKKFFKIHRLAQLCYTLGNVKIGFIALKQNFKT